MKNVLIISGSHRKKGNSQRLCEEFKKGAEDKGNSVELIRLAEKKIGFCKACDVCMKNNGTCVQKDDMALVFDELNTADMVVFAAPIYWFDITAQLKTVIDRLYAHGKIGFNFNKTALLLDAGADGGVFTAAITQYKAMTAFLKWEDKGIITIGGMMGKGDMEKAAKLADVRALGASL